MRKNGTVAGVIFIFPFWFAGLLSGLFFLNVVASDDKITKWFGQILRGSDNEEAILLASGVHGGLYHQEAYKFIDCIDESIFDKSCIEIKDTGGASENLELILSGEVELAIIQDDLIDKDTCKYISRVFPLYKEHLIFVCTDPDIAAYSSKGAWKKALKKISYGVAPQEMGSRKTTDDFLTKLNVPNRGREYKSMQEAMDDLLSYSIDGFFVVSGLPDFIIEEAKSDLSNPTIYTVTFPSESTWASLYINNSAYESEKFKRLIVALNKIKLEGYEN